MDLYSIKEPILADKVLHENDNLALLNYLFSHKKFAVAVNNVRLGARFEKALLENVQHAGFVCNTYGDEDKEFSFNDPLNVYAFVIVNQLSKNLGFKYEKIDRVNYNYYCQNQHATDHTDSSEKNEISIVYNPHTTDGGTKILDKKYPDIGGQAKIFKSNWLHSSYSTIKDKGRVSLNIKFKI